ncbi:hypothetical protein IX307_001512 [Bacteroides pyogenes]|nr:hypothetical protein [Bacteroides pyogenes]MBR8787188.1 hypothetical protein [Bacteroides pyogenes]MBR8792727.1 hypothetical protein [Bacteroides pyogenes]
MIGQFYIDLHLVRFFVFINNGGGKTSAFYIKCRTFGSFLLQIVYAIILRIHQFGIDIPQ